MDADRLKRQTQYLHLLSILILIYAPQMSPKIPKPPRIEYGQMMQIAPPAKLPDFLLA
jgi:hypothetical protein